MDVSADLMIVTLLLDQLTFEAPLEQVADTAVSRVEIAAIAPIEILHALGEIGFGCLHKEMVVVGHDDKRMQFPTIGVDGALQPLQPALPIRIIAYDVASLIAAGDDMIKGT